MKYIFSITAASVLLALSGCSETNLLIDELPLPVVATAANEQDSLTTIREQARQGDGQAYLQLARRHHDGNGVERDILKMWEMAQMAAQYGAISRGEEFFATYPSDDPERMLYEAVNDASEDRFDAALRKADSLAEQNHAYATLIWGSVAIAQHKSEEGMGLIRLAAEEGLTLATLLVTLAEKGRSAIGECADLMPSVYCRIARQHLSYEPDTQNIELVTHYYRMADAHLCLDDMGVRWMRDYYENLEKTGSSEANSAELKRLNVLCERMHSPFKCGTSQFLNKKR